MLLSLPPQHLLSYYMLLCVAMFRLGPVVLDQLQPVAQQCFSTISLMVDAAIAKMFWYAIRVSIQTTHQSNNTLCMLLVPEW